MLRLNSTDRFGVWGSTDGLVLEESTTPLPLGQVVLGNRRATLSDICRIAALGQTVSCDEVSLALMMENSAHNPVSPLFVGTSSAVTAPATPEVACRAMVIGLLTSMLHGKSAIRPLVAVFLTKMLNAKIIPAFSDALSFGYELASAITGVDVPCYSSKGIIVSSKTAFSQMKLKAISLTQLEATFMSNKFFYTLGYASLLAGGAMNVSLTLDSIAALSCEAYGADLSNFDANIFENIRQQRGQITSASNLRNLLEGSKRLSNSSSAISCFAVLPQIHGPAQDIIISSSKLLEIELNCYESEGCTLDDTQARLSLQNVTNALNTLLATSLDRCKALNTPIEGISAVTGVSCEAQSLASLFSLTTALSLELRASMTQLGGNEEIQEDKEENDAVTVNKKVDKRAKEEDDGYTPEQRAKAEAKRKQKAEKAAEKAKSKAAKKGGSFLPLGAGTALLKAFVTTSSLPVSAVNGGLLFPFDSSDKSLSAACMSILEKVSTGGMRRPKIPKGSRDFGPDQMRVREEVFGVIRKVFKRHGGVEIDTPVFELKEVLTGKYGEDSKLIYDLADQGGELLSLRYDLTVPFARFLAMNSVGNIKRFHMAKVYRRDNPQQARGRYREFYQCDFDIAGNYTTMVPDAEVITVAAEILSELKIGSFLIKLNHRRLLDAIFEICGVPADKFRPICSAVDKLDKCPWTEVRAEMVQEKGLAAEVADRIGDFVLHSGQPKLLWAELTAKKVFGVHAGATAAMVDLATLFDYLEAMDSLQYISFDLSLARGLDYYTGVIYEVVLTDGLSQVGSIAAGGRYDTLVGMFSASGQQTPCVGVSIGVERVFTIIEKQMSEAGTQKQSSTQVYVASIGPNFIPMRMKLSKILWHANISAEYSHLDNPKFKKQLDETLERHIPFMIVFGEEEISRDVVKVKNMKTHEEVEVNMRDIVNYLITQGCKLVQSMGELSI